MTVEEQIVTWIEASLKECMNLEPSDAGAIREVEEKDDLVLDMLLPGVHFVFGDTEPAEDSEDNRGYTHNTPLFIKIGVNEQGNPKKALRSLAGLVQSKLETDARVVEIAGTAPFVHLKWISSHDFAREAMKPVSVRIVHYEIQHRRLIGQADGQY